MARVEHTDLGDVEPSGRADMLIDRQRFTADVAGPGMRARFGVERSIGGASQGTAVLAVLTAGAVPAGMISLVGIVAGAPGWLVVTLAAVLSLIHLAVGAVLVERQQRHAANPPASAPGRPRQKAKSDRKL